MNEAFIITASEISFHYLLALVLRLRLCTETILTNCTKKRMRRFMSPKKKVKANIGFMKNNLKFCYLMNGTKEAGKIGERYEKGVWFMPLSNEE